MSAETPESLPPDVAHMTERLRTLQAGLGVIGVHAHFLERVIMKLTLQAVEIQRYRENRHYVTGHCDGWDAAMATGLPADIQEEARIGIVAAAPQSPPPPKPKR